MEKSSRIKGAESVLNLEPNSSIAIGYHALFGSHDDLMLLEIDEKLLPDILHERYKFNLVVEIHWTCSSFFFFFKNKLISL